MKNNNYLLIRTDRRCKRTWVVSALIVWTTV